MEQKGLTFQLKQGLGEITALFSRFNVVDHDGDLTMPGAFEEGAPVRILPAHDWRHYMIGKGAIRANDQVAEMHGVFFLQTSGGRDWYESIKADMDSGSPLQEWSYGFDVLDSGETTVEGRRIRLLKRLKVHEVSPVTLGAGINTGTVDVKAEWTTAYINDLPDKAFAYIEPGGEKDDEGKTVPRSLRHFPHHDAEGSPDAPHVRNALARIPQSTLSDAAKSRALSHVRRHADGMGIGKTLSDDGYLTFAHEAEHVLADVQALTDRATDVSELRAKEGRTFSSANVSRLTEIADAMMAAAEKLRELLASTEPKTAHSATEVLRLQTEYRRLMGRARLLQGATA